MDFIENLMLLLMVIHIIICPYTKVEESFNLQAIHDILYNHLNIQQYDHLEFPGVVPRSFIGPLFISAMSAPFTFLASLLKLNKYFVLHVVRYWLGFYVLWCFNKFQSGVRKIYGSNIGFWLCLITMSQFHFMFYMSRPLPNIMALGLVLLSLNAWLRGNHTSFLWFSGTAIIVFRADVSLFLGLFLLMDIVSGKLSIKKAILTAVPVVVNILGATVLIDSFFWGRWLWPEGEVFWYNTVLNKSSQWGTSPFLWYFYSVLPRALGVSIILIPLGLFYSPATKRLVIPAFIFVFLYSFLPHKELRFIIYVFPVLNVAVAAFMNKIWRNQSKSFISKVLAIGAVLHLLVNALFTCGLLFISHNNYPGGYAIYQLQRLEEPMADVHVHIDVAAAQTGVSRFLQFNDHWRYNKTEDLIPGGPLMQSFSHLLIGTSNEKAKETIPYKNTHTIMDVSMGFHKIKFDWKKFPPVEIISIPKIWILKRKKIV